MVAVPEKADFLVGVGVPAGLTGRRGGGPLVLSDFPFGLPVLAAVASAQVFDQGRKGSPAVVIAEGVAVEVLAGIQSGQPVGACPAVIDKLIAESAPGIRSGRKFVAAHIDQGQHRRGVFVPLGGGSGVEGPAGCLGDVHVVIFNTRENILCLQAGGGGRVGEGNRADPVLLPLSHRAPVGCQVGNPVCISLRNRGRRGSDRIRGGTGFLGLKINADGRRFAAHPVVGRSSFFAGKREKAVDLLQQLCGRGEAVAGLQVHPEGIGCSVDAGVLAGLLDLKAQVRFLFGRFFVFFQLIHFFFDHSAEIIVGKGLFPASGRLAVLVGRHRDGKNGKAPAVASRVQIAHAGSLLVGKRCLFLQFPGVSVYVPDILVDFSLTVLGGCVHAVDQDSSQGKNQGSQKKHDGKKPMIPLPRCFFRGIVFSCVILYRQHIPCTALSYLQLWPRVYKSV